jgi:hypothetical protein
MFRRIRIAILLVILAIVALNTWTDSLFATEWRAPMTVALFPINADGSPVTQEYIASLTPQEFASIESFFDTEIKEAGIALDRPIRIALAPVMKSRPPLRPPNAGALTTIMWSLHLRWWAWRESPKVSGPKPRIRIYLPYYDPKRTKALNHSTALKKGMIGVAQLFASEQDAGSNQFIIAHELLHTLGATDKYQPDNLPQYPDGFADPTLEPRYPQHFAEVMGGRIPLTPTNARIPDSLDEVLVGPATAAEIGWVKKK